MCHGVSLGRSRVRVAGAAGPLDGLVVSCTGKRFKVRLQNGTMSTLTGPALAKVLEYEPAHVFDPRWFNYDFSVLSMAEVTGWRAGFLEYVQSNGFRMPKAWLAVDSAALHDPESLLVGDAAIIESFRSEERVHLDDSLHALSDDARAPRTVANLRLPGIKLVWWMASRGLMMPPSQRELSWYLTSLAKERDNVGSVTQARTALLMLCRLNEWPTDPYTAGLALVPGEAMRRLHKVATHKVAPLLLDDVRVILKTYAAERPDRPAAYQWQLAVGTAIGVGFKVLARYDDLSQMRYDEGFCEVTPLYARFFLEERKNAQYQGQWIDIARPEDPDERGVYHSVIAARAVRGGTGFVLPTVSSDGFVGTGAMGYQDFVSHLRAALIFIGYPERTAAEYAAHSMRAGAATEGLRNGLAPADACRLAGVKDLNWILYYNRHHLADRLRASRSLGL